MEKFDQLKHLLAKGKRKNLSRSELQLVDLLKPIHWHTYFKQVSSKPVKHKRLMPPHECDHPQHWELKDMRSVSVVTIAEYGNAFNVIDLISGWVRENDLRMLTIRGVYPACELEFLFCHRDDICVVIDVLAKVYGYDDYPPIPHWLNHQYDGGSYLGIVFESS